MIIAAVFFGDLWIKNRIEAEEEEKLPRELAGGKLILRRYHNKGAALNFGAGRRAVVTALAAALTLLLAAVFAASLGRRGNNALRLGLAFLLGGAFSNTYDRLRRRYVVDYISFGVKWKRLRKIVFNISDFCIIIGSFCVACFIIKRYK